MEFVGKKHVVLQVHLHEILKIIAKMTFISGYILLLDACKSQIFIVTELCAILKEYEYIFSATSCLEK